MSKFQYFVTSPYKDMQPPFLSQYEIDLKKFIKGKRINKGGFGIVYQIQSKETNNIYAAKVIDCGDDEEQCNKIIDREVSIMMSLKHPTITTLVGYSKRDFLDENNITIVPKFLKVFRSLMGPKIIQIRQDKSF